VRIVDVQTFPPRAVATEPLREAAE
jgi:hypothetical protein